MQPVFYYMNALFEQKKNKIPLIKWEIYEFTLFLEFRTQRVTEPYQVPLDGRTAEA